MCVKCIKIKINLELCLDRGYIFDNILGSMTNYPHDSLQSHFYSQEKTKYDTKRAASCENRPDERRSGTTRNRTGDTRIFSPLLYQLSYGTIIICNVFEACMLVFSIAMQRQYFYFIPPNFSKKKRLYLHPLTDKLFLVYRPTLCF